MLGGLTAAPIVRAAALTPVGVDRFLELLNLVIKKGYVKSMRHGELGVGHGSSGGSGVSWSCEERTQPPLRLCAMPPPAFGSRRHKESRHVTISPSAVTHPVLGYRSPCTPRGQLFVSDADSNEQPES